MLQAYNNVRGDTWRWITLLLRYVLVCWTVGLREYWIRTSPVRTLRAYCDPLGGVQ